MLKAKPIFLQFFENIEDSDYHWEAGESKEKAKVATN